MAVAGSRGFAGRKLRLLPDPQREWQNPRVLSHTHCDEIDGWGPSPDLIISFHAKDLSVFLWIMRITQECRNSSEACLSRNFPFPAK